MEGNKIKKYVFRSSELINLMGLTGICPEKISPLWKVIQNLKETSEAESNNPVEKLIDMEMVTIEPDGILKPSAPSVLLLNILCNPSQVIILRQTDPSENPEFFLVESDDAYCIYSGKKDEDLYTYHFPLDKETVIDRISKYIKVDKLSFPDVGELTNYNITSIEGALLDSIQNMFESKKEMWFSAENVLSYLNVDSKLLDQSQLEIQLRAMAEKGILQKNPADETEVYCFGALTKGFLDPSPIENTIFIERFCPDYNISIIYLRSNGAYLMESMTDKVNIRQIESSDIIRVILN